jgi:hypothetical protein
MLKRSCIMCGQENTGVGSVCSRCRFDEGIEGKEPPAKTYTLERNPLLELKSRQPMYVLWLIREEVVRNKKELIAHFIPENLHPQITTSIPYFIDTTLDRLVSARLIEISSESEEIKVTNLYWNFRNVTGYSLKDFADNDPDKSMIVSPIFGKPQISQPSYDLFVLMPFRAELEPVYEVHVKAIAKELSMTVARADDLFTTGSVIEEVWSCIARSGVILADCTGRNPNVFYEIGIAHSLGKSVVLITQNEDDVPFDLRNRRFIKYEHTPPGMEEFKPRLKATLIASKPNAQAP